VVVRRLERLVHRRRDEPAREAQARAGLQGRQRAGHLQTEVLVDVLGVVPVGEDRLRVRQDAGLRRGQTGGLAHIRA
jgi:hypothetical protein